MSRIIKVAVLGNIPLADYVADRIRARGDLVLTSALPADAEVPAGTSCVVYLPATDKLLDGRVGARITALLRAGINVVTTVPAEALAGVDLIGACREGHATFHGTGGHATRLAARFNRAFSAITRNIREVELIEEMDVANAEEAQAYALEGHYEAGLRTLGDAVFHDRQMRTKVTMSASHVRGDETAHRSRTDRHPPVDGQLVVRRVLGKKLAYDSVWTPREGGEVPLRYRLNTVSTDAIGHVTIDFHAGGDVHPADHLACGALLEAIRPVQESGPGVLHLDLDINYVKPNECLH